MRQREHRRRSSSESGWRCFGAARVVLVHATDARAAREPGGAFRATVESTFYAMRLAGGQKFAADLTSDKRRRLEPQYNYAVFLAAACSSLDEPCRHFEFVRAVGPREVEPRRARRVRRLDWRWTSTPFDAARTASEERADAHGDVRPDGDHARIARPGWIRRCFPICSDAINPETQPARVRGAGAKVVRQAMDVAVDFEQKAQRAVFAPVKFDVPSAVHVALALEPQFVASAPPEHLPRQWHLRPLQGCTERPPAAPASVR